MTRTSIGRLGLLAALLALVVAAAGCGSGSSSGGSSAAAGAGSSSQASQFKVGLVTDIGGLNDRSFNFLANKGLEDAEKKLGVQGRVLESHQNSDYIPNLQQLAAQHYNLIISVGFLMGDATKQVAQQFPDTQFAIIDFAYDPPVKNIQGLVFKEQEAGYLAGYIAGAMTKSGTVSTVGGQKIPPVDHYIAGFQAGVKASNPQAKTLNDYSQTFVDQAPCKEAALNQISSGSDIVFAVAGACGLGALDAAKENSIWGIGVDADQAYLGPHILTSAMKRVDVAVESTIEQALKGTLKTGGVSVFGLSNGGVGIGQVSPKVPADVLQQVDQQKKKIISGALTVPDTVK